METNLTKTRSWAAAQAAKKAFCTAHKNKSPDCAAKRTAYTRALRICMREAGLSDTPVRGT